MHCVLPGAFVCLCCKVLGRTSVARYAGAFGFIVFEFSRNGSPAAGIFFIIAGGCKNEKLDFFDRGRSRSQFLCLGQTCYIMKQKNSQEGFQAATRCLMNAR